MNDTDTANIHIEQKICLDVLPAPLAPSTQCVSAEAVAEAATLRPACALPAPDPAPSPVSRSFGGLSVPAWLSGGNIKVAPESPPQLAVVSPEPRAMPAIEAPLIEAAAALSQPSDCHPDEPMRQLTPPPGAILHYQDEHGRPCEPAGEVYMWTWEGAKHWYHTDRYPVPTIRRSSWPTQPLRR